MHAFYRGLHTKTLGDSIVGLQPYSGLKKLFPCNQGAHLKNHESDHCDQRSLSTCKYCFNADPLSGRVDYVVALS